MNIRPGSGLIAVLTVCIGISLASFVWSWTVWLIPVLIAAALTEAGIEYRVSHRLIRTINVSRDMPQVSARGMKFTVGFTVTCENKSPIHGSIRDVIPAHSSSAYWYQLFTIDRNGISETAYEISMPKRGHYTFGPVWIRLKGRLNCIEIQRSFDCRSSIKIFPQGIAASGEIRKNISDEIRFMNESQRHRHHGEGTEFETLSPYREGDDIRRIDWRSSARQQQLMVRRFQVERHRDIMILVDCGRLMGTLLPQGSKLDYAVDSALMLSRIALENGDRCGAGLFDDQVVYFIPPRGGLQSHQIIIEGLYDAQSRWRETNFGTMFSTLQTRQHKRALVVIISDIIDNDTSVRFRTALASLSRRHIVIFAALRTPLLNELVYHKTDNMRDAASKAVSFRLMREREKGLYALKQGGVNVIDIEPNMLTAPLINKYIEIRRKNIL